MNILDAAEIVLLERGVPMPIEKVAEIVIRRGLWTSRGKTPKVSVASSIYSDMKRRGAKSRFVKTRAGTIDIRNGESLFGDGAIAGEGTTYGEREAAKAFAREASALPDADFEAMIRRILDGAGVREVERIPRRKRDELNLAGYVTLFGAVSIRIRVLAARWASGAVTMAAIDRVRRDLAPGDRGVVFSLRGFTREAALAAESDGEPPIVLFSAEEMLRMVGENA
ncbi:MAG: restriction endonuclease [Kiritimatiellae bacterium]|nr:restriction endonuclease [Kiritimatiellia bacterium]